MKYLKIRPFTLLISIIFLFCAREDKQVEQKKENGNPFPPKKIVNKSPEKYSPLAYIENLVKTTEPKLSFKATNLNEAKLWQKKLRKKLWELMGEEPGSAKPNPEAILLNTQKFDTYTSEKWEIEIEPGRSMPFYVLKPDPMPESCKIVLCLHGHGYGVGDIIGQPVNEEAREYIKVSNTDYALQSVKRGWCAIAPELFTFGERVDLVEDARPGFDGGCEKPFLNTLEIGKTLLGIRTKDVVTLINWIEAQKQFEMSSLSCMGLSGGGMLTMYVSALDERIQRALISGYMTEALDSIMRIRHCSCNYIPGLLKWADFPDIGGLIAPRYLIVQSGKKDSIFPIESAKSAYNKIKKVYTVFDAPENVIFHEHDGYHSFWSQSLDDLFD